MRSAWIGVSLIGLALAAPARAGEVPHLLADVNPGRGNPADFLGSTAEPTGFVQAGGRLLFSTVNENAADEGILWSTDGTAAGTIQASSSLCPAPCGGITVLAAWRNLAFLRIIPEIQAAQLWRSDGTAAGTFPLRGPAGEPLSTYEVAADPASDAVYFHPYTVADELWRSDGTQAGTAPVRAADSNSFDYPARLTFWKGRLYFVAGHQPAPGNGGRGLWRTDGTPAGTVFLADVQEGDGPARLVATPSHLFFTSGLTGKDLWATDGTPGGTHPLADLPFPPCATPPDSQCDSPDVESMAAFGDAVYFKNRNRGDRVEIWRSDGTVAGTGPLTELPGVQDVGELHRLAGGWIFPVTPRGPAIADPSVLWAADGGFTQAAPLAGCGGGACPALSVSLADTGTGRWLFAGQDPVHGAEPWITDGTGPGTRLLADVCPGDCDGVLRYEDPPPLAATGPSGEIYFRTHPRAEEDGNPDDALWATDGTPEGTRRVAGHFSGIGLLGGFTWFGGLSAQRAALELWRTDGTAAGTRRVDVLRRYGGGSAPLFLPFRGGARFLAAGGDGVLRLWASDGTPEGTAPLRGFALDPPRDASFARLTRAGRLAFFDVTRHGEGGDRTELWRTDGTPEGTRGLLALGPNQAAIDPLRATWGDRLLFLVDEAHGCSIWTSDGTAEGTRRFLPPPRGVRCPTVLAPLSPSRLLFVARVETPKGPVPQVFVTDGTVAGTRQITALHGTRDPVDDQAVRLGGALYFRIGSQTAGAELWRTDGTPEGTRLVAPLDEVSPLQVFQGDLYFVAHTPDSDDSGLFRLPAQGPPDLLAAAQPPPETLDPLPSFAPAGDRLLFVGQDDEHGLELWVTDGTPAGTRLLGDLQPGPGSSLPDDLTAAGGRVFFTADDGTHGRELWESDGTPEGTRMVLDLAPGGYSSTFFQSNLNVANGYLFFAADDGTTGMEPWALPLAP